MIISRRGVLASLLMASDTTIMDTHVHFYDPERAGGVPWPRKDDKLLYRRAMPEHYKQVSRAKVIIVEASPLLSDNQWILDVAAANPDLVGGCVGNLNPRVGDFARHLDRLRANTRFLGIRLGTRAAEEAFSKLGPLEGLSLDLIGGSEMYDLAARIATRYPGVRIILDHLPLPQRDPAIRVLRGAKSVYAKVSWILRSASDRLENHLDHLDEVWDVFGEDRVVYGSNWPVCDMVAPYNRVEETAISYFSKKPLRKYLFENSKAAYRWPALR